MLLLEVAQPDPLALYREAAGAALENSDRAEAYELGDLGDLLYATWYAQEGNNSAGVPAGFPSDLVAVLRAAHAAGRRWEAGWIVRQVGPSGMVAVVNAGEHRILYRSDYLDPARPGLLPRIGDAVLATRRRDQVDPDGSWWRTRSQSWSDATPPPDLIRLYWNVALEALPRLVGLLTELLDRFDEPWMLKCAVDVAIHRRADSVVLYMQRELVEHLADEINDVRTRLESSALASMPPFALAVGVGLAVAEDPGTGESFGQHRCRLVAEAVADAARAPAANDLEALTAAVVARFRAEGIDPARPHARGAARLPWERRL
jgi:hypothetical protein